MVSIYFVGTYKPILRGIAEYTSFLTRESPLGRWGVLSFNLNRYGAPLTSNEDKETEQVWYGIPERNDFSATVLLKGLRALGVP